MSYLKRIEEEKKADRNKIVYKGYNKTYDFRIFKTIRTFSNDIRIDFINIYSTNDEQNHFTEFVKELKGKKKAPYNSNLRKVKEDV